MLQDNLVYDPVRDLHFVEQFGFIDLKTALDSSVVPSQLPESETDYNGIDDPSSIAGRPHDIFEAIDSQKALEASASASASAGDSEEDS